MVTKCTEKIRCAFSLNANSHSPLIPATNQNSISSPEFSCHPILNPDSKDYLDKKTEFPVSFKKVHPNWFVKQTTGFLCSQISACDQDIQVWRCICKRCGWC